MGCQQSSAFVETADITEVNGRWKVKDYLLHPGVDTSDNGNPQDDDDNDEDFEDDDEEVHAKAEEAPRYNWERDNGNPSILGPSEVPETKPEVVVLNGRLNSLTDDFTIDCHPFRNHSSSSSKSPRQSNKVRKRMDSFHVRRGLAGNASHVTNAATGEDVAILKRSNFSTVGYSLFSFKPSFLNRQPSSLNLDALMRGDNKNSKNTGGSLYLHGILEKNWSASTMSAVAFEYYVVRSLPRSAGKNVSDEEAAAVRKHKCRIVYHVPKTFSTSQDIHRVLVHVQDAKTGQHLAYVYQKARTLKTALADMERIVIRMGGGVDRLSLALMIYAVVKIMTPGW